MKNFSILIILTIISVANAHLFVQSPARLRKLFQSPEIANLNSTWAFPGVVNASYSNFGFVPYGHQLTGRLFYDKKLDTMCEPIPETEFNFHNNSHERRREVATPMMIAERGDCSFVTKVRHMEEAGVAVAIIVDNSDESVDQIVMSDDGTGAGIRIPALLISKSDGKKMIDFLKTASEKELQQISLVADFNINRPDNRVEYDIWYSSSNDLALDFIQDFAKVDRRFGDQVLMTPRFVFWECLSCDTEFRETNCFGGGKYCAQETGNEYIQGHEIVLEDLRQMCVYKQAYGSSQEDSSDGRELFWDYVKEVHQECGQAVNEDCSEIAHDRVAGLDWDATNKCVAQSFSTPDKSKWHDEATTNTLIDRDLKYWAKYGSNLFPSVVINNQTFRGQLETQALMNALCAGFNDAPNMCKRLLHARDIEHNIGLGVIHFNDGYKLRHVFGVFTLCLFVLMIVLCLYRRHAKREMKQVMKVQIESAVNHYVSLAQNESSTGQEGI